MEVTHICPPVTGFLKVKLDQFIIDYLWNIIEIAKVKNIDVKNKLVGNISQSFLLEDQDSFFFKNACIPLIKYFRERNLGGKDPSIINTELAPDSVLTLNELWVNYQYQTEFNPYHDHTGVYSFAIWLKIPYDEISQQQLAQFNGISEENIKAGNFEFEYIDTLGDIKNYGYRLSPKLEGTMVFFPARLRHCVYPFYGIDNPRISIAGNIIYKNK